MYTNARSTLQMERSVEELKRKAHLLRTWGGDASLDDSVRAWAALRDRVRAHHDMFQHQVPKHILIFYFKLVVTWNKISIYF